MRTPIGNAMRLDRISDSLSKFWSSSRRSEQVGYRVGLLLLLSGVIHLTILIVSNRSWMGPLSLRKPATFGLSFGLILINICWVSSFLRLGRLRAPLLGTFTLACVIETALVSLQAWRGVPSHFNLETVFDTFVTRTLAGGGILIVIIIAVLTFVSFRANAALTASLRLATRVGFLWLFSALMVGAWMIAKGMLLVSAGKAQQAYFTGGAFKPAHAVAMHGILILPLLAWTLSLTRWSAERQLRIVSFASIGYTVLACVVMAWNFS
jgi:hypothetical protein